MRRGWRMGVMLGLLLVGLMAPVLAQATILTFDIAGLTNFSDIPGGYGDNVTTNTVGAFSYGTGNGFTPNVTTEYFTRQISNNSILASNLDWWNAGYGNLTNVAFPTTSTGHFGEVVLTPGSGVAVRLNGFDLAGYFQSNHPGQTVRILDGAGVLQEFTNVTVLGAGPSHSAFTFGSGLVSRSGALRIQYAFSDWNVGIDNIHFEQVAVVPLPPAVLLMGSGLSALAIFARRLNRKASV